MKMFLFDAPKGMNTRIGLTPYVASLEYLYLADVGNNGCTVLFPDDTQVSLTNTLYRYDGPFGEQFQLHSERGSTVLIVGVEHDDKTYVAFSENK